jgi:hypothetical protein
LPGNPDFDPVAANASDLPLHLEVLKELPDDEDYDGPLA